MNPCFTAGTCPQCGYGAFPGSFPQTWLGTHPAGFSGMPYNWFGTYAPGFQGWTPGSDYWGWNPSFQGWNPSPMAGFGPPAFGYGLGGLRHWGGAYSPQYTTTGLPTDEEIAEMIYDSIDADPLIPWDADIDVSVDAGTVTLAGTVPNKRIKHAAGDDTWWIPGVTDVNNSLEVSGRHRVRGAEAAEAQRRQPGAARRTTSQP